VKEFGVRDTDGQGINRAVPITSIILNIDARWRAALVSRAISSMILSQPFKPIFYRTLSLVDPRFGWRSRD
jgi:hypothetical protein